VSADARGQAEAILDELVVKGLLGAGLVGRDGLPLILRFPRPVQEETFSAMAAAVLGAAEAAMLELSEQSAATVTIEAGRIRLAISGLDDTHLFVLAAPANFDAMRLQAAVADGRKRLLAVLGG
jgi:predicted regulator of Ras-like GTPase activity (Roadblock/LC7/MglB family)